MGKIFLFVLFIIIMVGKIHSSIMIKETAFPKLKNISGKIGTIIAELFSMYISWYIIDYIITHI